MSQPLRIVSNDERRARLAIRHALVEHVSDPVAAASAVACFHATEPTSIYLSAWARSGVNRAGIDQALYHDRSIVRQLAMRRTVFAFPRDLLPAVRGSAAARVAAQQAALLARSVVAGGIARDGIAWVEQTCSAVIGLLRAGPSTTTQLRARLPALEERLPPPGQPKATPVPVAAQVMTVLAAGGGVVRGMNNGGWKVSRPRWTLTESWLGGPVEALTEAAGYAELVDRWLWAFGPGTEDDVVWWLGATKGAVRRALADVGAVAVQLENGSSAWLHRDDVAEVSEAGAWAALLPILDPTTMGWRCRDFYVDKRIANLVYDRAGNGMATMWVNGRIVGGWTQDESGKVVLMPVVPLQQSDLAALRQKARELTAWLDGDVIRSTIQPPLKRDGSRTLIY